MYRGLSLGHLFKVVFDVLIPIKTLIAVNQRDLNGLVCNDVVFNDDYQLGLLFSFRGLPSKSGVDVDTK